MNDLYRDELSFLLQQRVPGARVSPQNLPGCEEIALLLIDPLTTHRNYSADDMATIMQRPAYWSLCWASGLALAKFLLDHPEWIRGKRVLDFGSGSGVVAIAAAKAGARQVIACDIDPQALQAVSANASLNNVTVEPLMDLNLACGQFDLLIAADVLYDAENLPSLDRFLQLSDRVLVADSRIRNFSVPPYVALDRFECSTFPDLDEFDEFRQVTLYSSGFSITDLTTDG